MKHSKKSWPISILLRNSRGNAGKSMLSGAGPRETGGSRVGLELVPSAPGHLKKKNHYVK